AGCSDAAVKALLRRTQKSAPHLRIHVTRDFRSLPMFKEVSDDVEKASTPDDYAPYNKPFGLRDWLATANPPVREELVVVLDPDFLFIRPFAVNTGGRVTSAKKVDSGDYEHDSEVVEGMRQYKRFFVYEGSRDVRNLTGAFLRACFSKKRVRDANDDDDDEDRGDRTPPAVLPWHYPYACRGCKTARFDSELQLSWHAAECPAAKRLKRSEPPALPTHGDPFDADTLTGRSSIDLVRPISLHECFRRPTDRKPGDPPPGIVPAQYPHACRGCKKARFDSELKLAWHIAACPESQRLVRDIAAESSQDPYDPGTATAYEACQRRVDLAACLPNTRHRVGPPPEWTPAKALPICFDCHKLFAHVIDLQHHQAECHGGATGNG
ncbi:hypothetical protein BBJ28_00023147, partial [Nothophytophthora sp. Chile5]